MNIIDLDLDATGTVALRKLARELGIKGMSSAKGADLRAAIKPIQDEQKAEAAKAAAPVKNAKRGTCTECGRKEDFRASGLCTDCREYAEWENTHDDEDHEQLADSNDLAELDETKSCPVCRPELDIRKGAPKPGRSRAGMVIVAKGSEVHKSMLFKREAEAKGWTVQIMDTFEGTEGEDPRYVAVATKGDDRLELSWNGRAYDYPSSSAQLKGKARKVRNLKEALRLI